MTRFNGTTLSRLEAFSDQNDAGLFRVTGNCMEKAGIVDGGTVVIDFTHMPRPGNRNDPCLCIARWPGRRYSELMVKAYGGRWGDAHIVHTQYASIWQDGEFRPNVGLFADRIFGVVIKSFDREGKKLWEQDPEGFPAKLPAVSTVKSENCEWANKVVVI